jgi:uncharacterized protein YecT (DUF1311 family)
MRLAVAMALIAFAGPALAQTQAEINTKCSAEADARGLHGQERLKYRAHCKSPDAQSPAKTPKPIARKLEDGPSFDCTVAKSAAARLICTDADLIVLDWTLGRVFADALRATASPDDRRVLAKEEMSWLWERSRKCGLAGKEKAPIAELKAAKQCLDDVTNDRISELRDRSQNPPAAQPAVPSGTAVAGGISAANEGVASGAGPH